jgi:hypothetical protein
MSVILTTRHEIDLLDGGSRPRRSAGSRQPCYQSGNSLTIQNSGASPEVLGDTFLGANAGAADTSGDLNVFMGYNAGVLNTCGRSSVFIGANAGSSYVSEAGCPFPENGLDVFIGSAAGQSLTSGLHDVFIGEDTGLSQTTGNNDTYLGSHAGTNLITTDNNTYVGASAGDSATTTGGNNTVVGSAAAQYFQGTAAGNVFVGYGAGQGASGNPNTASNNSVIGYLAGGVMTSAGKNSFLGYQAGAAVTTGGGNALIGYQAGYNITSGVNNAIIGNQAGLGDTTGSSNIVLGVEAGDSNTTGSHQFVAGGDNANWLISDVYFGRGIVSATPSAYTIHGTGGSGSNIAGANIAIAGGEGTGSAAGGSILFETAPAAASSTSLNSLTTDMTVAASGNIGIGTSTPFARLTVSGPDTASTSAFVVANSASTTELSVLDNGNATLAGNLIQNSDQRLKTNVQSLEASSSLALIDALNPVTFNWIDPSKGTVPQLGFIAQQVLPIFPNLISTTSATALTPNGTLSLNYIGLISPIVAAIQALSAEITSLENTVAAFTDAITTKLLTANAVQTQQLCVGSTCVTPQQFQAMVAAASASQSPMRFFAATTEGR